MVPELREVRGAGKPSGHADDGDVRAAGGWAGCHGGGARLSGGLRFRGPGGVGVPEDLAQVGGDRGNGRPAVEQRGQDLGPVPLADARAEHGETDRVHAELPERHVDGHLGGIGTENPGDETAQLADAAGITCRTPGGGRGHGLGPRAARRAPRVPAAQLRQGRTAQAGAVHLAVERLRERGQFDQDVRDHMGGQALRERLAAGGRGVLVEDEEGVQDGVTADPASDHRGLADPLLCAQHGLDLAGLDAEAAHLHLGVQPAQVLDAAVGQLAHQVTGAVAALAVEGDEPFGGQFGAAQIAGGEPRTADVQLAGHPGRHRPAPRVEDVQPGVGDGAPDGDALTGGEPAHGRPDGGLGGPEHVPHLVRAGEQQLRGVLVEGLSPAQHLEPPPARPARGEQHLPRGGGGLDDRGRAGVEQPAQEHPVPRDLRGHDLHPAAGDQRQEQFERGDVEADGGEREQVVVGGESRLLGHGEEQVGQRPVRHLDALGAAGRPGGVDHVRRVVRARHGKRGRPGRPRPVRGPVLGVDHQDRSAEVRAGPGAGDQEVESGVLGHVPQPLGRVVGVEGHIGAARGENAEQGDEHVGGTVDEHADVAPRRDPAPPQPGREGFDAGAQFAVRQCGAAVGHRHGVGGAADLVGEERGQDAARGVLAPCEPLPGAGGVLGAPQGERAEALVRGGEGRVEQQAEVLAEQAHGVLVEEVRVVLQAVAGALGLLDDLQGEVELSLLVDAVEHSGDGADVGVVLHPVLEVEGGVEQARGP
ncbi:hypothetical protein SALBM135S_01914 [Streptomyces alboniger]